METINQKISSRNKEMLEKRSTIEKLKAEKEEYQEKEKVQYLLVFAILTSIIALLSKVICSRLVKEA